jgi:carbamoyl-phosphate synthase large subunit
MKDSILVFGVGELQKSIIERCKKKKLFVVGIDPMAEAMCRNLVDAFEVVGGQDFEKTVEVAERYNVKGIVTAATDKPLVMMARVAEKLQLPFFSVETAEWSTDKLMMKQKFQESGIPCANGFILNSVDELTELKVDYPVIVKPRDNSGSRGVIYCNNLKEVEIAVKEALQYTKKGNVLIEEFIEGQEYSIEGIHYNGEHHVIQYTEKITTPLPYNVELGHIQPADISDREKIEINSIISRIAASLGFMNCASHTELKINQKGIFVIETSPRLGGDFITSHLVPLSTGVNMEEQLINISLGDTIDYKLVNQASLITYFNFPIGTKIINTISADEIGRRYPCVVDYKFNLKTGDEICLITNSLNRYGYFVIAGSNKQILLNQQEEINIFLENHIVDNLN